MKRRIVGISEIVILALVLGVGVYNAIKNPDFGEVTIAQLLTPLIALGFAFWATQYKNDERKSKEHAEKILFKIQDIVNNDRFSVIPVCDEILNVQKEINITNRKMSNYLQILQGYAKSLGFLSELKYIRTEFEKYRQKTGDHIADLEYLSKTESEFRKIAENIDTKCESIILKLYK